ncbi:MAG TPA: FG-GAP-like repeat-containing protein [archaeon]|nr:FG-GAP-like repeat-containing protein [archaeon]
MTKGFWALKELFARRSVVGFVCCLLTSLTALTGLAMAQNPVPLINDPVVPNAVRPGGAAFGLTVNGTGFVSASVVHWNATALTTRFVSGSQLTARVPAADVATPGTAAVTVVNPGPGGGRSNVEYVVVHAPITTLTLASSVVGSNEQPETPALADLNGDGKLDLIGQVGNGVNAISVRLGNGDGTFQPEVQYPVTGSSPVIADFNGDGKLDIAVVAENYVSVLLGNGDGTFQSAIQSPIDPNLHAFQIAAGDFNGDGKLDLVVGYQDPNSTSVSVLLGNGDGTFKAPVDYTAGSEPGAVAVADLNRDGKLDIVAANFGNFGGNTVSVLLGNGDGTFQPQVQYATQTGALAVIIADFNGDGIPDLAVDSACGGASRCGYPGEISILLGKGDGTFDPYVDYPADAFPYSVAAGDLTANGVLDLAVPDLDYSELSILLGNGDGTFAGATTLPASNRAVGVVVGDLNGDGALDLVVGTDAGFTVFLQAPTATLSSASLTFGSEIVDRASFAQTVTLTNTGGITLTIGGVAITGNNAADFSQTNDCGVSLASGARCAINVTFKPSATGPAAATVAISSNAANGPLSVSLRGVGVTLAPNPTLSTTSLTFATQVVNTTSAAQSITLTNYGETALRLQSIAITGANSGDFSQTNNCGSSLATLASCTINVAFTPTTSGNRAATLSFTDNGAGGQQTVTLQGTGTVVAFNPTSLGLGSILLGQSSTATATMTNVGVGPLSISGITITGADPGDFSQTNTCGSSLSGGGSCTITVVFKPLALGARNAAVSVTDNGGGSPQDLVLSGYGRKIMPPPQCCYKFGKKLCPCPPLLIGNLTTSDPQIQPSSGAGQCGVPAHENLGD